MLFPVVIVIVLFVVGNYAVGYLGDGLSGVIEAKMMERRTGLEVVMWDERLTTVAAERTLIESSVRRENRKQYVDKIAAVFILQGYLDLLSMRNGADGED